MEKDTNTEERRLRLAQRRRRSARQRRGDQCGGGHQHRGEEAEAGALERRRPEVAVQTGWAGRGRSSEASALR